MFFSNAHLPRGTSETRVLGITEGWAGEDWERVVLEFQSHIGWLMRSDCLVVTELKGK